MLFSLKYYSRVGLNTKSTRLHFCASTNASAILESFQFSCRANLYFGKLQIFLCRARLQLGLFSLWGSKLVRRNRRKCVCSDKKKFGQNCNFQIKRQNIVKSLNFLIKPCQRVIENQWLLDKMLKKSALDVENFGKFRPHCLFQDFCEMEFQGTEWLL